MHHIFFPPRLEVVVEQQNADRFSSYRWHQFPLHRFFGHQTDGPACAPLWRIAAYHGDDPLFLVGVQYFGRTGPLLLMQLAERAGAPEIAKVIPLTPQAIRRLGHGYEQAGLHGALQQCQSPQNYSNLLHGREDSQTEQIHHNWHDRSEAMCNGSDKR